MEQRPLLETLQEKQSSFDWIIMNKNGYRGSINKMRFIGSNTSTILESVDNNLIILNWNYGMIVHNIDQYTYLNYLS
jgi:hypothetical protein